MPINLPLEVVDILISARGDDIGRYPTKGVMTPVTLDVENPWFFKKFMVRVAGDVVVVGKDNNPFTYPACQPGIPYQTFAKMIQSAGTTATGIYIFGGV